MIGIYKITSPSGKVYVGQSIDIDKRFRGYKDPKQQSFKNQTRLKRSMLKYGWVNHTFEVICECAAEDLDLYERKYQEENDAVGPNGLNCLLTKTDALPRVWSLESRKNMGKKGAAHHMYGKSHSAESIAKISSSKKGKPSNRKGAAHSEASKAKMIASRVGKKASEETRARMSASQIGKKTKKCMLVRDDGSTLTFNSMLDAAKHCIEHGYPKAKSDKIGLVCNGKRKKAYGFSWAYATQKETA